MAPATPLRHAAAERRVDALFRAMSTDFLLKEQFVTDPAQVLSDYVSGVRLSDDAADALNRVIYSVVVSRPLFVWLRRYALDRARRRPTSRPRPPTKIVIKSALIIGKSALISHFPVQRLWQARRTYD